MKDKLLLDASVFALLIICMEYNATGSFIHEIAGIIMLTGIVTEEIQESSAKSSESEHVTENIVTEDISEAIDNAVSEAIEENKKREEAAESQITESAPEPEVQTDDLEEYLSKLVCTGCGRRCPLTAPQCRKGESQAQRATEEFYNS